MGMFDFYETDPSVVCPYCEQQLSGWQSKDGPCGLFVWRQGSKHPVDQKVDEDVRWSNKEFERLMLPQHFRIAFPEVKCIYCPVAAVCSTENDVWTQTKLVFRSDAPPQDGS